jgi:protein-S-isoprenylcysteine O-methyltransferase Ste14
VSGDGGSTILQGTQPSSAIEQAQRSLGIAADVVVVVHAVFVAFLLSGGFLAWWWPGAAAVHVLALVASAGIYLGGFDCPLTNLEKHLRTLAGEAVYQDGFIAHYLVRPVYAGGMTAALGLGLLALVVGTTLVAYGRHLV